MEKYPDDAWALLRGRLTPERQLKLERAAAQRTNFVRLVVQDIHQPHNVSACLRSAEAFGVLNVDVVRLTQKYTPSTTARGVEGWLRLQSHTSVEACAALIKGQGYALCAAVPPRDSIPLEELPLERPLALVFGNEHCGLDPIWQTHIDHWFSIPMVGLVESFNISVAAAISLYETTRRVREAIGDERYFLTSSQQQTLLNEWICRSVKSWEGELAAARDAQGK